MKRKKKFIVLLALVAALSLPLFASAEEAAPIEEQSQVQISLSPGNPEIIINDQVIETEAPYVTESGTTLVPLRIITEAFGAAVIWDETDQSIVLSYQDVAVALQIGNPVAMINGRGEQLPEAPVLSESGTAMIPLRFVAECFGAFVRFDEQTGVITVTKTDGAAGGLVQGITDQPRIGDSHYGWSIDTPVNLFMESRSSTGASTQFYDDNRNTLQIVIMENSDKNYDLQEEFIKARESFYTGYGYILADAQIKTDTSGASYICLISRSGERVSEQRVYYTTDYIYRMVCTYPKGGKEEGDQETKNSFQLLMDSFALSFGDNEETHDITTLNENGRYSFKNEEYGLSMEIPKELSSGSSSYSPGSINSFYFSEYSRDITGGLGLTIYSMPQGETVSSLMQKDRTLRISFYNEDMITASDPTPFDIAGTTGASYTVTLAPLNEDQDPVFIREIYFEKNGYLYMLTLQRNAALDGYLDALKTLQAEELDPEKTGGILRTGFDTTPITIQSDYFKAKLPVYWEPYTYAGSGIYENPFDGSIIFLMEDKRPKSITDEKFKKDLEKQLQELLEDDTLKQTGEITTVEINGRSFYHLVLTTEEEDALGGNMDAYFYLSEENQYSFLFLAPSYATKAQSARDFDNLISTFTLKEKNDA